MPEPVPLLQGPESKRLKTLATKAQQKASTTQNPARGVNYPDIEQTIPPPSQIIIS